MNRSFAVVSVVASLLSGAVVGCAGDSPEEEKTEGTSSAWCVGGFIGTTCGASENPKPAPKPDCGAIPEELRCGVCNVSIVATLDCQSQEFGRGRCSAGRCRWSEDD